MGIFQSLANMFKGTPVDEASREQGARKRKIPRLVEVEQEGGAGSPLLLTADMIHDKPVDSIRTREGVFFLDGRSYVSEFWAWEGVSNVTYYFPAAGVEPSKEVLEAYLVSMGKLVKGERHPLGVTTLTVQGEQVYSVTVAVGSDDGIDCEVYCKAEL